jgi:RNA polymerase sigma-70 factor (ECF subfamily)
MGSTAVHLATEPGIDEMLVREVRKGSESALGELYDRHADAVFASAMQMTRDRWMAEEVVQETFLALWERAEQFDPSRGALRSWLVAIARHRSIDRLRAAGRHHRAASFAAFRGVDADDQAIEERLAAVGDLIGVGAADPLPDVALTEKETRAAIEAAIGGLAPIERRVIVLAYDSGLSQSEIAASLGWPIGTVKTRTRRALRHLRERLTPALTPMPAPMPLSNAAPCTAPCP